MAKTEKEKKSEPKLELLLFAPKSNRGLRFDYPELANIQEFKNLRKSEMLFVWYYACKSSPYYDLNWPEVEIIKKCLEASELVISDGVKKANFLAGSFPDNIREAIPVMNSFEPNIRMLLKIEAAKDISDIKKLTSLSLDDDGNNNQFKKEGEVDFGKKKHYMDMIQKKNEMLPVFMAKSEFGLLSSKESRVESKIVSSSGRSFAEEYHDNNG